MKSNSPWKQFALVGLVVLVGYFAVFNWVEHRRVARGPWQITFTQTNNSPALVINQSTLGITNVTILFANETATTNLNQTVAFGQGRSVPFDLPFGKCVFLDPLFLPGTVACEMFGHQIQIMPRAITIDDSEHSWVSGETVVLTNKPAPQDQR